jgi:hypothetical protein
MPLSDGPIFLDALAEKIVGRAIGLYVKAPYVHRRRERSAPQQPLAAIGNNGDARPIPLMPGTRPEVSGGAEISRSGFRVAI